MLEDTGREEASMANSSKFALERIAWQERFVALGFQPIASTSEEFGRQIHADIDKWAAVIRAAHITVR